MIIEIMSRVARTSYVRFHEYDFLLVCYFFIEKLMSHMGIETFSMSVI